MRGAIKNWRKLIAKSNWKDIAELIGIMAIVASLIALTMELRQTQSALLAETYQSRAFDAIAEQLSIADSEFLMPVLAETDEGANYEAVAALNAIDRLRLVSYLRGRMIDWDNEYYQYQKGFLDADFFEVTTTRAIKEFAPRWRAIGIEEGRADFRKYVDQVLGDDTQGLD